MSDQPRPTGPEPDNVRWLRGLCDLAKGWVQENEDPSGWPHAQTGAYADLIFSFGLARLAAHDASVELLRRAQAVMIDKDDAHKFLCQAFE